MIKILYSVFGKFVSEDKLMSLIIPKYLFFKFCFEFFSRQIHAVSYPKTAYWCYRSTFCTSTLSPRYVITLLCNTIQYTKQNNTALQKIKIIIIQWKYIIVRITYTFIHGLSRCVYIAFCVLLRHVTSPVTNLVHKVHVQHR
jgi:hypothetical protein